MQSPPHKTADVYGITRDLPLNYPTRESVDTRFIESLALDKHVVLFGSSKQGKTCLRKHCLQPDDCIVVQCSNKWNIAQLNAAVLKKAGYQIDISTTKTLSGQSKIRASVKAKLFGAGAEAATESARADSSQTTQAPLELDPEDANDIISALEAIEFSKFIVLEDFHYLPPETQKDFSISLKAFHEGSKFCFIVVGVWLEENRLLVYNGDLVGRLATVNADRWTRNELCQAVEKGEALLNIQFAADFKDVLLQHCLSSIYIVQEVCRRTCESSGVYETCDSKTALTGEPKSTIQQVVNEQSARYNSFLVQFSEGFQETELQMYRWLLHPLLTSSVSDLEKGIPYATLNKRLKRAHPRGKELNPGNLTQALQNCANLQIKKGIQPLILDYDHTSRRLSVVDRGFLLWLPHQEVGALLETAGFDESADR